MNKIAKSEGEVARCRRVREGRDRQFGTLKAALRHFADLEAQGNRPVRKRLPPTTSAMHGKKTARSA
jgi:hypothetical protein